MAYARYRDKQYVILNYTEDAEWVLRDEAGDRIVVEQGTSNEVQAQCEHCGRASSHVAQARSGLWLCHARDCYKSHIGGDA